MNIHLIPSPVDPNKHHILDTNMFNFTVGATLSQNYSDDRHPIGFFSKAIILGGMEL